MLRFLQSPVTRHFFAFCIAFAASRMLFAAAGFHYDLLIDPFNPAKLAIDFGVWVAIYMFALRKLTRAAASSRGEKRL